jgi:hypothetical protein
MNALILSQNRLEFFKFNTYKYFQNHNIGPHLKFIEFNLKLKFYSIGSNLPCVNSNANYHIDSVSFNVSRDRFYKAWFQLKKCFGQILPLDFGQIFIKKQKTIYVMYIYLGIW